MTPTDPLIGQVLIALVTMALGFWAAVQWAATTLRCQPGPWPFLPSGVQSEDLVTELVSAMLASALEAIANDVAVAS